MSAICSDRNYPTETELSALALFFYWKWSYTLSSHKQLQSPITQAGIAIRNDRTVAQNAELEAFLSRS